MGDEEDSIEQAAAARRERLRALKAAQELLNTLDEGAGQHERESNDENGTNEENNLNMKFRNYVPHDKQLQEGKLAPPVLPKFEDPVAAAPPPSEKEDPFVNIAPKKPNWDLRRDVQKKLDELERRTQKGLFKIMEEQEKRSNWLKKMAAIVQKTKTRIFVGEAQLGNCGKSSAEEMSLGKKISVERTSGII